MPPVVNPLQGLWSRARLVYSLAAPAAVLVAVAAIRRAESLRELAAAARGVES